MGLFVYVLRTVPWGSVCKEPVFLEFHGLESICTNPFLNIYLCSVTHALLNRVLGPPWPCLCMSKSSGSLSYTGVWEATMCASGADPSLRIRSDVHMAG